MKSKATKNILIFQNTRISLRLLIIFLLFLYSCSSSKKDDKKKNIKNTQNPHTIKSDSKKNAVPSIPKISAVEISLSVPSNALGYGAISSQAAMDFYKGWTGSKALPFSTTGNIFFILLSDTSGSICPVFYKEKAPSPGIKCLKIGDKCYYPDTKIVLNNFKNKKLKIHDGVLILNLRNKNVLSTLKWKKLKKLHIKNIKIALSGSKLTVRIRSIKKSISKDLRNALYYWQQLAIESRTDIFRMGKYGEKVAKTIVKSKIKLNRKVITFNISMESSTTGWSFMQLNRLYKVICSRDNSENSNDKTN